MTAFSHYKNKTISTKLKAKSKNQLIVFRFPESDIQIIKMWSAVSLKKLPNEPYRLLETEPNTQTHAHSQTHTTHVACSISLNCPQHENRKEINANMHSAFRE